jgi:hypothetical protein
MRRTHASPSRTTLFGSQPAGFLAALDLQIPAALQLRQAPTAPPKQSARRRGSPDRNPPITTRPLAPQIESETTPDGLFLTCPSVVSVQPIRLFFVANLCSGSSGTLGAGGADPQRRITLPFQAEEEKRVPIILATNTKHHRPQRTSTPAIAHQITAPKKTLPPKPRNIQSASKVGVPRASMTP